MECELCGAKSTKKIEIDGAVVSVCDKCSSFGKEIRKDFRPRKRINIDEKIKEISINPNYSSIIKNEREKRGITKKDLGKLVNEKESFIARIEKKKTIPSEKTAKKLEKALGVRILGYEQKKTEFQEKKSRPKELTLGDIAEIKMK